MQLTGLQLFLSALLDSLNDGAFLLHDLAQFRFVSFRVTQHLAYEVPLAQIWRQRRTEAPLLHLPWRVQTRSGTLVLGEAAALTATPAVFQEGHGSVHFAECLVNVFLLAGHGLPVAVDRSGRAARGAPQFLRLRQDRRRAAPIDVDRALREADAVHVLIGGHDLGEQVALRQIDIALSLDPGFGRLDFACLFAG